jgi:hypothetical protein
MLSEGFSDVLYHRTYFTSLKNILEENAFQATSNIGSSADFQINKGKYYFFSMTRSKYTGYHRGDVNIVIDGRILGYKHKGYPIDYWQYSTKPSDWGDTMNNPHDRASYLKGLQSKENEDRLISDVPLIKPASDYIIEVHVLLDKRTKGYTKKSDIVRVVQRLKELEIPAYFYMDDKYFNNQIKDKAVDPLALDGYKDESEENYNPNRPALYGWHYVVPLLIYKDNGNLQKLINGLNLNDEHIEKLQNDLNDIKYNYLSYNLGNPYSSHLLGDFLSSVKAEIHNKRSSARPSDRFIIKMIVDDLKEKGTKDIKDYILAKTAVEPKKETLNESIIDLGWFWVSPENQIIRVPKLNHNSYIEKKYPDAPLGEAFDMALKDGWVRGIVEYNRPSFRTELSLNGYNRKRVKSVFKTLFWENMKYGWNVIYLDYEHPKGNDVFSTYDSEGKDTLIQLPHYTMFGIIQQQNRQVQ